jgi:hypothetical protein
LKSCLNSSLRETHTHNTECLGWDDSHEALMHTSVASSNYNMTLTRICCRWCMWNCRKPPAVICFSTLQSIIQAWMLSVSPKHSTGKDLVCMHTEPTKHCKNLKMQNQLMLWRLTHNPNL